MNLFRSMSKEKAVKPNSVIFGMMVCRYCRQGGSYRALRLLRQMRDDGMVPNVASYGLIIRVL